MFKAAFEKRFVDMCMFHGQETCGWNRKSPSFVSASLPVLAHLILTQNLVCGTYDWDMVHLASVEMAAVTFNLNRKL